MKHPYVWYAGTTGHYIRRIDGPFEAKISRGERRKLLPWPVQQSDIEATYPIIIENRRRKNRVYRMSLEDWQQYRGLSRCYLIPGVAAAMCMEVAPTILYVSAWGDIAESRKSPIISLCKYIYDTCGYEWLDIGTAEGSLSQFKERLGFVKSAFPAG